MARQPSRYSPGPHPKSASAAQPHRPARRKVPAAVAAPPTSKASADERAAAAPHAAVLTTRQNANLELFAVDPKVLNISQVKQFQRLIREKDLKQAIKTGPLVIKNVPEPERKVVPPN